MADVNATSTRLRTIRTDRVSLRLRERGSGEPVLFVHGNLSSGAVWSEQLELLPAGFRGMSVDLRGFGHSDPAPVDATRGLRDYSDDLRSLIAALELGPVHAVGHSLGAGVVIQLAIDAPELVRSLALLAPISPYGFGGTRGDGTPCTPDHAGSGAGTANPEFVRLLREGDRGDERALSPRNVIRSLFFPSPDVVRGEECLLDAMLRTRVGDDHYPGDTARSSSWPGVAPGMRGVLNAASSRWCDLTPFAELESRPPVLWVRGDCDAIVSDASMVDLGQLGAIGAVPGWPGEAVFPPQPMVSQMRALLDHYATADGTYREHVLEDTGHFPFTQRPHRVAALLRVHLEGSG